MLSAAIIGASGFTGAELLRIAAQHPDFDLVYATGDSQAGVRAADLYPSLAGVYPDLVFEPFEIERARGLDLVFLGLPHEASLALAPQLIVVSGDITQRATCAQFDAARRFLEALPRCPRLLLPGNHDIPLFALWQRAFSPYARYRAGLGVDTLAPTISLSGVHAIAVKTTRRRRHVEGLVEVPVQGVAEYTANHVRAAVVLVEVLEADPERRETVGDPAPTDVEEQLLDTFEDFRRAMDIEALSAAEFEEFGPVQHFRDAFIAGWTAVREAIDEEVADGA